MKKSILTAVAVAALAFSTFAHASLEQENVSYAHCLEQMTLVVRADVTADQMADFVTFTMAGYKHGNHYIQAMDNVTWTTDANRQVPVVTGRLHDSHDVNLGESVAALVKNGAAESLTCGK